MLNNLEFNLSIKHPLFNKSQFLIDPYSNKHPQILKISKSITPKTLENRASFNYL